MSHKLRCKICGEEQRNKIDALKTAPKHRIVPPVATKPKNGAKVKNWIKERFFKRRGRE